MSPSDRHEKLRTAREWLEKHYCYLAADVMSLGRPLWVEGCGTAYVAVLDDNLIFGFDPVWYDALPPMELVTVLLHETMHVVFRHVFAARACRGPFDAHLYNLACDAVVNDRLLAYDRRLRLPEGGVTGEQLIGAPTIGMTAEQVYQRLHTRPPCQVFTLTTLDSHQFWAGEDESAAAPPIPHPALQERLTAALQRSAGLDRWGDEALGRARPVKARKTLFDLEALLIRKIARKLEPRTHWAPPDRRLMALYPDVLLPVYTTSGRRRVLLALDASGSISDNALSLFTAIAHKRLEGCQVEAISFDTRAYPYTLHQDAPPQGGGGTRFQAIEEFALSRPRYPDVVVIFTDGYGPRPRILHPERWLWCLTAVVPSAAVRGLGEYVFLPAGG